MVDYIVVGVGPNVWATIVLSAICVTVVLGNTLVLMAISTFHRLRRVPNIFIGSLALADLLLGIFVLPFSATKQLLQYWVFGVVWCNVWLVIDVWLCTSSILSLVVISIDRHLAIGYPVKHTHMMTPKNAKLMMLAAWLLGFVISCPPMMGWNDWESRSARAMIHNHHDNLNSTDQQRLTNASYLDIGELLLCELNLNSGYVVYSALGSFYIPLLSLLFFYTRIYQTARRTTDALKKGRLAVEPSRKSNADQMMRVFRGGASTCETSRTISHNVPSPLSALSPVSLGSRHRPTPLELPGGIQRRIPSIKYSKKSLSIDAGEHLLTASVKDELRRKSMAELGSRRDSNVDEQQAHWQAPEDGSCPAIVIDSPKATSDEGDTAGENCGEASLSLLSRGSSVLESTGDSDRATHARPYRRCLVDGRPPSFRMDVPRSGSTGGVITTLLMRLGLHLIQSNFNAGVITKQLRRIAKEKKAARTVGVVVGVFVLCWLPFFVIYLIMAFREQVVTELTFSVVFWLGYCNSAINPFIYAMCSRDFRVAFSVLLRNPRMCLQRHQSLKSFIERRRHNVHLIDLQR